MTLDVLCCHGVKSGRFMPKRRVPNHRDTDLAQHCRRVSWKCCATTETIEQNNGNFEWTVDHTFATLSLMIKNGLRSSLDRKTS